MAEGFGVDPVDLQSTASALEAPLGHLRGVDALESDARVDSHAWGLLGERVGLHARYSGLLTATTRAVDHMGGYLEWVQHTLLQTAARYVEQDDESAGQVGRLLR